MIRFLRHHIVLVALAAGLGGSAIGESIGMPNSWAWFAAGVTVGTLWVLSLARRHPRRRPRRRVD